MSATAPRVLASVLNFNAGEQVLATVASLRAQTYASMDLVVFDNDSSDGSRDALQRAYPSLAVMNTGANLGYCGGNNAALEYGLARGYDAVIVLNHDIELKPDAVERLMRMASSIHDAGVIGAQEVDGVTGANRVLGGRGYDFWWSRRRWVKDRSALGAAEGPVRVDYVQGACVLLTRRALERGIRFSEAMFAYADEIDLGFQAARAGLGVWADPDVAVWHTSRGTPWGVVEGYLMQRNRWYLVRRYGRPLHRVVNFLLMTLVELPAKVLLRTLQGHADYGRACLLGFVDGVRGRMGVGRVPALARRP